MRQALKYGDAVAIEGVLRQWAGAAGAADDYFVTRFYTYLGATNVVRTLTSTRMLSKLRLCVNGTSLTDGPTNMARTPGVLWLALRTM